MNHSRTDFCFPAAHRLVWGTDCRAGQAARQRELRGATERWAGMGSVQVGVSDWLLVRAGDR